MSIASDRSTRRPLLVLAALILAGCGGSYLAGDAEDDRAASEADATSSDDGWDDGPTDGPTDEPDSAPEGDRVVPDDAGSEASEYVVLPPASGCGDGILDPGEECDDRNRLNGDGCDWTCALGDGDPPPPPEPTAGDFAPEGGATPLFGTAPFGWTFDRAPLVWTGSEFATAWPELPAVEGERSRIRFWRFDASGRRLDAEWGMPWVDSYGGLDVVWTGSGFGLFFSDLGSGLWYLRLDAEGKPVGEPVLVVDDSRTRAPAADLAPDGTFVVAWLHDGSGLTGWSACSHEGTPDAIRLRRVAVDGSRPGPVYGFEGGAGAPDIATGSSGVGLVFRVQADAAHDACGFRFVRLDESLADPVYSGVLGESSPGDVKWIARDSRWVTSWTMSAGIDGAVEAELRVAFVGADGVLAGPPARTPLDGPDWVDSPVRIVVGDDTLVFAFAWASGTNLSYILTDPRGTAVSWLRDVVPRDMAGSTIGAYDAVGTDDGFAVLFAYGWPAELHLQRFVHVE